MAILNDACLMIQVQQRHSTTPSLLHDSTENTMLARERGGGGLRHSFLS